VKHDRYDVIVVGGGHAGCEAAHAVSRCGGTVALVTLDATKIGVMSCNPAIGGLGKGHLVREIDALDGVMARAGDYAGIQFRLLNASKGPAVQGPRIQADRARYLSAVQKMISTAPGLEVVDAEVFGLHLEGGKIAGVTLANDVVLYASAVILTTGTFLGGTIHIGDKVISSGRYGEAASNALAAQIGEIGLPLGRLKTGTPPRLRSSTVDWSDLETQDGDADPTMLSFISSGPEARQIRCGITHTNERTHEIIHSSLHRSALHSGQITGAGPRYCPSIEDKVTRFADKPSHQVFLEPEGLDSDLVYPNGISTSLPAEVQTAYVRSIAGLEHAEIVQPGYAIEYDFVDPRSLDPSLAVREIPGLYLAGQINGTTGYEEAAAQGLVAGLNAIRRVRFQDPMHFSRTTSYIGVLLDDLISRGVSEPYRMFTSRAEYRLSIRADNADQRLTEGGRDAGCVGDGRWQAYSEKRRALDITTSALNDVSITAAALNAAGLNVAKDGPKRSGLEALAIEGATVDFLEDLGRLPLTQCATAAIRHQVERDAVYAPYLERQTKEIASLRRDEQTEIPGWVDYSRITGLSNELKEKLERIRPVNLYRANSIEGMTPSAMLLILAAVRHGQERLAG